MADVHTTTTRRARKPHRCCECDLPIESGERYAEHSGIHEGEPYRYRRCLTCNAWADVAHELCRASGGYDDEGPRFGGVAEWLAEWANELGCIYVPLNLAARLPVNRLAWADYVPWGCWDGWSSRPASAACRPDVLAAHRTPLMWRCVVADQRTNQRDARNALRRAVVLWPSTDVPGGARRAIVGALDHAERGRWRAALAETSRAVSLARNLAERAALRRAINDALVSLRAIVGALDDSRRHTTEEASNA